MVIEQSNDVDVDGFLPTPIGSEALAYLGWRGSTYHDAAYDVALLRRWENE